MELDEGRDETSDEVVNSVVQEPKGIEAKEEEPVKEPSLSQ